MFEFFSSSSRIQILAFLRSRVLSSDSYDCSFSLLPHSPDPLSLSLSLYNDPDPNPNPDTQTKPRGFLATGSQIIQRETPLALYKGLGAVLAGIVPKMSIRFASFETYKGWLADPQTGVTSVGGIFVGGSLCSFGTNVYILTLPLPLTSYSGPRRRNN